MQRVITPRYNTYSSKHTLMTCNAWASLYFDTGAERMQASGPCLLFHLPVEMSGTCLLLKSQLWMWWQIIKILSIQSRDLDIKYIAQIHTIFERYRIFPFLPYNIFKRLFDTWTYVWRHCNFVRYLNHADSLLFWSLAMKPGAHFTKALWARYPPLWNVHTTLTKKKTVIKSSHS